MGLVQAHLHSLQFGAFRSRPVAQTCATSRPTALATMQLSTRVSKQLAATVKRWRPLLLNKRKRVVLSPKSFGLLAMDQLNALPVPGSHARGEGDSEVHVGALPGSPKIFEGDALRIGRLTYIPSHRQGG